MHEINVLYSFDSNFTDLAIVAINQMLSVQNADTHVNIHCLVAPRTYGYKKLRNIVKKYNATLIWKPVPKRHNPFRKHPALRWSPVIFYRLFAYKFFPNIEKILYMDSDTLVYQDLTELFNTDLGDNVIGAVRDLAPAEYTVDDAAKHVKQLMADYLHNNLYFNSGVLLIDMKKISKYEHKFANIKIPLKFPDQDLINVVLYEKILRLPLKYNYAPYLKYPSHYTDQEIKEAETNYVIAHFYTGKPYFKAFVPRAIYSMFENAATAVGFTPEMFAKQDTKRMRKRTIGKTHIPFVRVDRKGYLRFFGFKI